VEVGGNKAVQAAEEDVTCGNGNEKEWRLEGVLDLGLVGPAPGGNGNEKEWRLEGPQHAAYGGHRRVATAGNRSRG